MIQIARIFVTTQRNSSKQTNKHSKPFLLFLPTNSGFVTDVSIEYYTYCVREFKSTILIS